MSDVTRILEAAQEGDPKAAEELLPLVYDELRRLAAQRMALQPPGQTLQATALVHEAWLKLAGSGKERWESLRRPRAGPVKCGGLHRKKCSFSQKTPGFRGKMKQNLRFWSLK